MEGSHELSNAIGPKNAVFWLMAEKAGSPLKIFPSIGSATPPTAYEQAAGYYGYQEMEDFLRYDLRVHGPWRGHGLVRSQQSGCTCQQSHSGA